MEPYEHPTKAAPKTINVIALGPTQAQYHATHAQYDPPVPRCDENWTCNKGFRTVGCDLVFILDDLDGERRKSARYAEEIRGCKAPIITSIIDQEVAAAFPYENLTSIPIHEMIDFYGVISLWHQNVMGGEPWENVIPLARNGSPEQMALSRQKWTAEDIRNTGIRCASYLKNSVPVILAYAGYLGVRSINLWGADYDYPGQNIHEADKPNAEYWVAATMFGLGMLYQLPANTTLLSTNQGRDIYGFGARQPILQLSRSI